VVLNALHRNAIAHQQACSHPPTPSCVLLAVACRCLFPNTSRVWDAGWPASGAHVLVVRTCHRHCTSVSPHIQHNILHCALFIAPFPSSPLCHAPTFSQLAHPLMHPSRSSNHTQSPRAAAATGDGRGNMLSKFESKSNRVKGDHSPRLSLSPTKHSHPFLHTHSDVHTAMGDLATFAALHFASSLHACGRPATVL
jgi:hypothetical protein